MSYWQKIRTTMLYMVLTTVILLAIFSVVIRFLFSTIDTYRADIESLVGNVLKQPVTIESINARFVGLSPSLVLNNITLLKADSLAPFAYFKELSIGLDSVASIRAMQLIFNRVQISQADIVVERQIDGQMVLGGFGSSSDQSTDDSRSSEGIAAWLLTQGNLVIKQSKLLWIDRKTSRVLDFSDVSARIHNNGNQHQLFGKIKLPQRLGHEIEVIANIKGQLDQKEQMEGDLYFRSEGLNLETLEPAKLTDSIKLSGGTVNAEFWGKITKGKLRQLNGQLALKSFALSSSEYRQTIPDLSVLVGWNKGDFFSELYLRKLTTTAKPEQEMPQSIDVHYSPDNGTVRMDSIGLKALAEYAKLFPEISTTLNNSTVDGAMRNIFFSWDDNQDFLLATELVQLDFDGDARLPDIRGFDGYIHWENDIFGVAIDSKDIEVGYKSLLNNHHMFDQIKGTVFAQQQGEVWQIWGDDLQVQNRNLQLTAGVNVMTYTEGLPLVDVYSEMSFRDISQIRHYLPVNFIDTVAPETSQWLSKAFHGGNVISANMILHGMADEFPYNDHNGAFRIDLDAKNVTLQFDEQWPLVTNADASVSFNKMAMDIQSTTAKIYDSRFNQASISIADFNKPYIKINGSARFPASNVIKIFNESPLQDLVAGATKTMIASGDGTLDLALGIPISTLEGLPPFYVKGALKLDDAHFVIMPGVELNKLNGTVRFNQNSISADSLNAQMYGRPATMSIYKINQGGERTVIAAKGGFDADVLKKIFVHPLTAVIEGGAQWQSQIEFWHQQGKSNRITVASDLKGAALNFPSPLSKSAHETRQITFTYTLDGEHQGDIFFEQENYLKLLANLNSSSNELNSLHLHMGRDGDMELPGISQFKLTGSAENIDLKAWRNMFTSSGNQYISRAEINMDRLQLLISADDMDQTPPSIHFEQFPVIDAHIKHFSYNNVDLGTLRINSRKLNRTLLIPELTLENNIFLLTGKGEWGPIRGTELKWHMKTPDIGNLFSLFDLDSMVTDGSGFINATTTWRGSPVEFSLEQLKASLHMDLKDGVIEEVEIGDAGNLIGMFSIKGLFRRLKLDFSDIRDKGVHFDKIKGDLNIRDGQSYTENLRMESLPANVLITGRMGLTTKDFDQTYTVVPNVSDTLSVAGALAWGPQTAALLLFLNKVFEKNLDANAVIQYHLGGSWSDPQITKISDDPKIKLSPVNPLLNLNDGALSE